MEDVASQLSPDKKIKTQLVKAALADIKSNAESTQVLSL